MTVGINTEGYHLKTLIFRFASDVDHGKKERYTISMQPSSSSHTKPVVLHVKKIGSELCIFKLIKSMVWSEIF